MDCHNKCSHIIIAIDFFAIAFKAELEAVSLKMKSDKMELEQRLEHQAKLLDSRAAKIRKLEGICPLLRNVGKKKKFLNSFLWLIKHSPLGHITLSKPHLIMLML